MIGYFGLPGALAAAGVTAAALWMLRPVAFRWNLVDVPHGRKTHASPTPYIGGIAILMGVGAVAVGAASMDLGAHLGFALGCVLLGVVGLLDDKYDIRWYWRVLLQMAATLSMVYIDGIRVEQLGPALGLGETNLGVLSVPITVVATVGLINAVNMADGIDGAAGCLVATALALLAGAAWYSGNAPVAQSAVLLLGAVVAFLAYNMRFPWQPRARCFLGNAGSAFLGFAMAWLVFRLTQNAYHPVSPVLALWFLPIPVMDTLVLMVRRIRTGRSPFDADRNHIHHLIEEAGVGPTRASVLLALVSLACGLAAGQALRMDVPEPLLLGAFGLFCLGWYWVTRHRRSAVALIAALLSTRRPRTPSRVAGSALWGATAAKTRRAARAGGSVLHPGPGDPGLMPTEEASRVGALPCDADRDMAEVDCLYEPLAPPLPLPRARRSPQLVFEDSERVPQSKQAASG